MERTGKLIIVAGLMIVLAGIIIWLLGDKLKLLGRLPGDIRIEKENLHIYIPITTMLLISVVLSLVFRILQKIKF